MVSFYKPIKKTNSKEKSLDFSCESLDIHARGVGKINGKTCFVEGVLPGEKAKISPKYKDHIMMGELLHIIEKSPQRQEAYCSIQDKCGGCPLYYMDGEQALKAKLEGIKNIFKKASDYILSDVDYIASGEEFSYRRSCRLSARSDHKKIILGFREAKSHNTIIPTECLILTPKLNALIDPLNKLVNSLANKKNLGHIEMVDSDSVVGLAIRFNRAINDSDKEILTNFAKEHKLYLSIVEPYIHEIEDKEYLRETNLFKPCDLIIRVEDLELQIKPTSFVQINKSINDLMIEKVMEYAELDRTKTVLDLFCGLGNFTFPSAKRAKSVVGVDVVVDMINQARTNAQNLKLENINFAIANLDEDFKGQVWTKASYDVAILDPGRMGAYKATDFVSRLKVKRIIMISCNPLAAARDCKILKERGYKLARYAVFNMFPKTTHIELMLVFDL